MKHLLKKATVVSKKRVGELKELAEPNVLIPNKEL